MYPLKGAESLLLIIRNLFRYGYAHIAPLGHREAADLVRVQGSLTKGREPNANFTMWFSDG